MAATPAAIDGASSSRRTNADPTITPSAYVATCAACSRVETPRPTATGTVLARLTRATSRGARSLTWSRAPVTPMVDAA